MLLVAPTRADGPLLHLIGDSQRVPWTMMNSSVDFGKGVVASVVARPRPTENAAKKTLMDDKFLEFRALRAI